MGIEWGRPGADAKAEALWRLPLAIKLSDAVFVHRRVAEQAQLST